MDHSSDVEEAPSIAKSISNDALPPGSLYRTPSVTSSSSTTSSQRDRTKTVRIKRPLRQPSILKTPTSAALEDKSLTSFPSLSPPDDSPSNANKIGGAQASLAKIAAEAAKTPTIKSKPELKQKRSIVAALTAKSPSYSRGSLFEDSPTIASQTVPGALHYASDAHIERLVARTGAVKLVRQLAEDLAQREAEMSSIRQRSELRERELKKMLREVEVGNMDIEARLHALDQTSSTAKTISSGKTSSIGEMMQEALASGIEADEDLSMDPETRLEQDRQATIRAKFIKDADNASLASQDTGASKTTSRGWKDYLWSGTATKKSSRTQSIASVDEQATTRQLSSGMRRKGLDETLFQPPSTEQASETDGTRATSVSSWTMKLFAGGSAPARETTSRGRASTGADPPTQALQSKTSRTASQASSKTTGSIRTGPRQNDGRNGRRPLPSLNFGPNNNVKSSSASGSQVPLSSPSAEYPPSNLGPVEMDAILPHGSRPPTLTPSYYNIDNPDDLLTDRFGFIYDQRRRKKEVEALARMSNGKGHASKDSISGLNPQIVSEVDHARQHAAQTSPVAEEVDPTSTKRWQEYLKLPSKPTELLSHTPSSSSIITLSNPAIKQSLKRTLTFENIKENEPSSTPNPLPSTFTVTASKAEIASPVAILPETPVNPAKSEFEPVKALLSQLTDLHDNLQREKTVKWNEFFRKVRIERRREEETAAAESKNKILPMPEANLTDGETIGIATLGNKGKTGRAKYREFKALVLSGIPVALRAKVWTECSGAAALRIPGYYSDLVATGEDDPVIVAQIQMDINRTLTDNVFFRRGPGVEKLNEVLLAYSRRNMEVGYCQGMNLITASLLLIMPTAEDAFWLLVSIVENILPRHYFDNSLLTSRADQQVLKQYVSELLPKLASHLELLSIDLEALTFQWFLSLFTACLNAEALYRVWDVLLCCKDEEGNGGSTFLFQVALALLKLNEAQLIALESPGEVYSYLGGEITNHAISIDGLIKASEGLKSVVRRNDVEERRANYVHQEKEEMKEREALGKGDVPKKDGQLDLQDPLPMED